MTIIVFDVIRTELVQCSYFSEFRTWRPLSTGSSIDVVYTDFVKALGPISSISQPSNFI